MPNYLILRCFFILSYLALSLPVVGMMEHDQEGMYAMNPWHRNHHNETINVLSIDGGGVRGVIPAAFLQKLENDPMVRQPIANIFDLIVGTSTGALIALGMTTPYGPDNAMRTAQEMVQLYTDRSNTIFPSSGILSNVTDLISKSKYSPVQFENLLEYYFGEKRLSDCVVPTVATSVDVHLNNLRIFRNYRAIRIPQENFLVRDVARASSAAPTYFPMKTMEIPGEGTDPELSLVDGGMAVNNPSLVALTEAYRIFGQRPVNLISLGTGEDARIIEPTEHRYFMRARPTIDMLFSAQSDSVDEILSSLSEDPNKGIKYYRFQISLSKDYMDMDLADNVSNLLRKTNAYLRHNPLYENIRDDLVEALNERANCQGC